MKGRRVLHAASATIGICAALLTGAGVVFLLTDWLQYETYRLPPISQPGYFFGVILAGLLGAAQVVLALRPETGSRAASMIAVSGALALVGAIAGGAGRVTAGWLFYAGAMGLLAGAVGLTEVPRRAWLGLVGLVGAVLVFGAVTALNLIVGRLLFP